MVPIKRGSCVCEYESGNVYPVKRTVPHMRRNTESVKMHYIESVDSTWLAVSYATRCHDAVGRLLNHAPATVLAFRPLLADRKWRVGLLATKDIDEGEEICWDYG